MNTVIGSGKVIQGAKYVSAVPGMNNPSDYTLRILITSVQFIYLLTEKKSAKVVELQPFQFSHIRSAYEWMQAIDFIFENQSVLKDNFSERKMAVFFPAFTLVPAQFDLPDARRKLMELNIDVAPDNHIFSDKISSGGPNILYSIPQEFLKRFAAYSNNHLQHTLTPLLQYLLHAEESAGSRRLYAYIQSESFQLIYIKEKSLRFCNSFNFQSPEDFIYHLLFVCHQLHLDPELITVTLMGEIMRESALYQLTNKYIRKAEFAGVPKGFEFADDYTLPSHFFFNLFCI